MNNDKLVANKAAEEGECPTDNEAISIGSREFFDLLITLENEPCVGHRLTIADFVDAHIDQLLNDRASRQVANKAMDIEEGSDIRWVADGQIFGRPTATDLLEMAESRLEDGEMFDCCKSDVRVSEFKRIVELVASKAEVEPYGWSYECVQPGTDGKGWSEFFSRNEPKPERGVRNITPLYATPPATTGASTAPRPTDDELWDATLRDRDAYHDWADKLADAIAKHFNVDIGEHSNQNLPWDEALQAIENAEPVDASTVLTDERINEIWLNLPSASILEGKNPEDYNRALRIALCHAVAREVAAQAGQVAVPEGFVLVPVKPTPKMVDATFNHVHLGSESHNARNKRIYAAMIAAAPSPAKESK